MAADGKEPILDFMVVRAPERVADSLTRRRYIHDRVLVVVVPPMTHVPKDPIDPQALERVSSIGRLVYELVLIDHLKPTEEAYTTLRDELLGMLQPYRVPTPPTDPPASPPPVPEPRTLRLDDLASHAYLKVNDLYYILPDRLEQLVVSATPLIGELLRARPLLEASARPKPSAAAAFDAARLRKQLESIFGKPIHEVAFSSTGHSDDFVKAHRALFDALYLLYLMRRWVSVDLSDIVEGLQLLHAFSALAVDSLYDRIRDKRPSKEDQERAKALARTMPELIGWDASSESEALPLVRADADLAQLLDARPIVHPLLAKLFWFEEPFNDIKPIGVGDLKVVKQWLTAYLPGDISHIHNIMRGEQRSRLHNRTERSEEVFSLTTSRSEDTTRDTQSTERFEVKAEAENVVRASLNVTANANLTYNNSAAMITASAGAGFGYTRATDDHAKTAHNFARDVVAKAVERVQSQTASQRTLTQTFETTERNKQSFNNVGKDEHVSGIYRWVDKQYTAQVYNYGKRMMFEFVIPQPAAFWVESKLAAYENSLDVPQPPFPKPVEKSVDVGFIKDQIDEARFSSLKVRYDLRNLPPYPVEKRTIAARDTQTRSQVFSEKDITGHDHVRTFDCSLVGAAGYRVTGVFFSGYGEFHHRVNDNRTTLLLNGGMVHEETRNAYRWPFDWRVGPQEEITFTGDDTSFALVFNNEIKFYDVQLEVDLERLPATLANWQQLVWDTIVEIERKKLAADFEEEQLTYQARLSEYRNRLAQIKARAIGEILAGRSDAANRAVIDEEIKKHCLVMLTKEFDSDTTGDVLSTLETIGSRNVTTTPHVLTVTEATKEGEFTTVGYDKMDRPINYPVINIEASRKKGSIVQFLEQAFEWERLSYIFYPYFWAGEKDWVELMNREDDADATFTAFLRSGMARVLVAATPAYEDAILYYLYTREPWAGGRTPVIGDTLFVSLHDELREQTDDRTGGEADGDPWTFVVPTSLVYLHESSNKLPDIAAERAAAGSGPSP